MTPQQIADTAAALGFDATLHPDGGVTLEEEVWTLADETGEDDVWTRYVAIRRVLRTKGLDLPLGCATLGRDYVFGTIVPMPAPILNPIHP